MQSKRSIRGARGGKTAATSAVVLAAALLPAAAHADVVKVRPTTPQTVIPQPIGGGSAPVAQSPAPAPSRGPAPSSQAPAPSSPAPPRLGDRFTPPAPIPLPPMPPLNNFAAVDAASRLDHYVWWKELDPLTSDRCLYSCQAEWRLAYGEADSDDPDPARSKYYQQVQERISANIKRLRYGQSVEDPAAAAPPSSTAPSSTDPDNMLGLPDPVADALGLSAVEEAVKNVGDVLLNLLAPPAACGEKKADDGDGVTLCPK